jgi:LTXXQ motif family protein
MRIMLIALVTTALISPVMAQQEQTRPEAAPQTQTAPSPALPSASSDRRDQIRSELRDRVIQRLEQRLANFKSALRLTPEQETNWPAFESGVRNFVRLHAEQLSTMRDEPPTSPADRLRQRAERLASMSTALKHLADVEEAVYNKLSDAQKDRFRDLARMIRRPGTELEDRDQFSERDEFKERSSWRHPRWRRHMRDEDDEDSRERRPMWRGHMRDEDDENWRERHHMIWRGHMRDDDDRGWGRECGFGHSRRDYRD